jgi:1-acyl-sn-glycerol-3-phosphate acyltransferase
MTPAGRGARILLTGCTGFVGKVVLEELMRRREELNVERVYLLIRPRRRKSPEERFDHYVAPSKCFSRLEPGWRKLCHPVAGDMLHDGLGLSAEDAGLLHDDLTHIIHCAASVRFDLPLAEASSINISGALRVLEFARGCVTLERLVDVSTAYVTPHDGNGVLVAHEKLVDLPFDAELIYEKILSGEAQESELLARTGHPNTYTFTKCLAELILTKRRGNVPLTLLRPSIVSACRQHPFPGWIDSHAAYAAFISLLGAGHLRVVRTDPNTLLDVVPCDDVAARILDCTFDPALQQPVVVRHAVAGLANSGATSRLAKTHEKHFKAAPHEREAGLLYVGPSKGVFRLNELMHHQLPLSAAKATKRFRGQKRAAVRIKKLAAALGYLDEAFHYFTHHTFDFRTAFPPLERFDLDSYLESVSHGISEHLLKRNPVQAPLRMHGTDLRWALRQPEGNATTRAFAYVVRKALRAGGAEITFNETEIKSALREVRSDDLVILAPSHRSYLDFLITSLLCFAHPGLGLKLPRVAATDDFARIPIIGRLLEGAGAFYIKRGVGAPDPQLTQQIVRLVEAGQSLEFYPEGTRSRSRRFLSPKRGILRALQQAGRPAVVVPLSISYDRIAEEEGFLRELEHGVKHKSGLAPLLKWTRKLMRRDVKFGRIHIRAGSALRIDADTDIKSVSNAIVAELQRHSAVTSFHIRVFCEQNARLGIDPAALRSAIIRRGGVIIESKLSDEDKIPPLLRRTYDGQWMHLFYHDARVRLPNNAAVASHIRRNGFWYPESNQTDDELADAVVEALFEPVCRDYQRVAREVERMPADGVITAHDVVARLKEAFLGDVEDALADLAERGVLVEERGKFRWANGRRDLSDFQNDCAWSPAWQYQSMIS